MTLIERLDIYEKLTRLDKPIGILLLLWPTLWGLWLASAGSPNLYIAAIFVMGVVLMRSAGCIMNDFADRNFDGHVERTRGRPLAAKRISSREALTLAAVLAGLAFALVLQLNALTVWLSVAALALAVIYPFLKRVFWLPQAWLGVAFGFGLPMAFAAHHNVVVPIAWTLLLANVFWAIAYDTQYAMVAGLLIAVEYALMRTRQREGCFKAFVFNNWIGAVIFAGIAADFLFFLPLFPGPPIGR